MEVAVLIGSHKLVAGCHGKGDLGLLTGLKSLALVALLGLEADPLDVVLLLHGVGDGTHGDGNQVAVNLNHGNVLFGGSVGGVGHQLLHLFAAAADLGAVALDIGNDVAAMGTFKELHIHGAYLLYIDKI